MPCYGPLKGWYNKKRSPSGKRAVTFNISDALTDRPVDIPCGQCIGCRLDRTQDWAIRCHHEASMYEYNSFLTLTYNDENLPSDLSVSVVEMQLFMKRLRKKYSHQIRFYLCGEYGDEKQRPHYHVLLFNHEFRDKSPWKKTKSGQILWRSEQLEELWKYGHSSIGTVTFQSAGYVARYIMKKLTGQKARDHYHGRQPEFTNMSRKPGIGQPWLDKFRTDVFPGDFVVIDGRKMKTPQFYTSDLERMSVREHQKIKWTRRMNAVKHKVNNQPARLKVREIVQQKKAERLLRTHDKET